VKVHFSSKLHDWGTPQALFDELHAEFNFTIDVCATHSNAKLPFFFSPEQDGLSKPWAPERCFMNPPYGRQIGKWMHKALSEARNGALVVCLVPARTDTNWWHDYAMKGQIRFLRGRLKFQGAKSSAPFPSAVVIFRPGYV